MANNTKYWKGFEELENSPAFQEEASKEFPEYLPMADQRSETEKAEDSTRRDFLKLMGFGVAAATLAACEAPVRKIVPYIKKPESVDPSAPNYYASTYAVGGDYCSVLVKTREGRPIHVEGNKESSITKGGVNAQISASVLGLYDKARFTSFKKGEAEIAQGDADKAIIAQLQELSSAGEKIVIVSNTILSPSTKAVIEEFKAKYSTVEHVTYDAVSASGLLKANGGVVPGYNFEKAEVIVGFNADFLGTWVSPIEYSKQYSKGRKVTTQSREMSKHFQFETTMTITGGSADVRKSIRPSEEGKFVLELYKAVVEGAAAKTPEVSEAAKALKAAKGKALVVSGSNEEAVQVLVKAINEKLGANGNTIDTNAPAYYRQGDDAKMAAFVEQLKAGQVGGVIFYNANPVYDYPKGAEIAEGISKAKLSVAFNTTPDETASLVQYNTPDNHYLESWGDAEPKKGFYSLQQPTISPLFKTRQAQDSLLVWAGADQDYYEFLQAYWEKNMYAQSGDVMFASFWDKCLHDGVFSGKGGTTQAAAMAAPVMAADSAETEVEEETEGEEIFVEEEVVVVEGAMGVAEAITVVGAAKAPAGAFEVQVYPSVAFGAGEQSNNPWLQEMPDPISKVTWDNYLAIAAADAQVILGLEKEEAGLQAARDYDSKVVSVTVNGKTVQLPVVVQPGQAQGTVSVAMGYGRKQAGRLAEGLFDKNVMGEQLIGVDVMPFISVKDGVVSYSTAGEVTKDGSKEYKLARTQTSYTASERQSVVQETTLPEYKKDAKAGQFLLKLHTSEGTVEATEVDLWKFSTEETHKHKNHHWGLAVDLNSCTGCSACVISCHAENNVPVVGRREVINRRDMHWMRIDRYYSSDYSKKGKGADGKPNTDYYEKLEIASDNPKVVFQPLMCQHCNHATCETVCPVAATSHSTEGLNQMAYNRCIGTRYCANNCAYKVRRFNWFDYALNGDKENREFSGVNVPANDDLGRMVLNPDVTVRARGVMEKCSMCVQRIQLGKLEAKKEGRPVKDGDIVTACASVCPTDAITFGDMNDKDSAISQLLGKENSDRSYHALEELNTQPNVSYLRKVRNTETEA